MKEACEELVKRVETGGAEFGKGRLMELEASDGMFGRDLELGVHQGSMLIYTQLLSMLKLASFSTGTPATRSARNAVSLRCQ